MTVFKETLHLSQDEEIMGTYRSHAVVVIVRLFPFCIFFILTCLFLFPFLTLGLKGVIAFVLLLLVSLIFIFTILSQWIGTITVVTSRRIMQIIRTSMLKKQVKEFQLETITEISYDCKGVLQTVFSLGDMQITALYTGTRYIILRNVECPQRVLDRISHAVSRLQKNPVKTKKQQDALHPTAVTGDEEGV
jgi:hypothetical protein